MVSFGPESLIVSSLDKLISDETRLDGVGGFLEFAAWFIIPSNPTRRLAAVAWLSLRIMISRRPGAG